MLFLPRKDGDRFLRLSRLVFTEEKRAVGRGVFVGYSCVRVCTGLWTPVQFSSSIVTVLVIFALHVVQKLGVQGVVGGVP